MSYQQEKFKQIADSIRAKTGETGTIKPSEFHTKIDEVYNAGKKSEYDTFWDAFQKNGNMTNYNSAFIYNWDNNTFRPKYNILPKSMASAFSSSDIAGDLVELMNRTNTILDTSNCTDFKAAFYLTKITRLGTIDVRKATQVVTLFFYATKLQKVDKLIVSESNTFVNAFKKAEQLHTIMIDGNFGQSFDMPDCPLSADSFKSVINALSDNASGKTATFSKVAKEAAFQNPTDWDALINMKKNWTISLV